MSALADISSVELTCDLIEGDLKRESERMEKAAEGEEEK